MADSLLVRALLVSDLHYDLRVLDWVLAKAPEVDLVVVAGDMLNIAAGVPLDAQIVVALEYLGRMAERATVVACSGNHDLDHRNDADEKATRWILEASDAWRARRRPERDGRRLARHVVRVVGGSRTPWVSSRRGWPRPPRPGLDLGCGPTTVRRRGRWRGPAPVITETRSSRA